MSFAARGQADQVGCQFDGARHLLGDDLAQQLAPDGQVGVPEPGPLRGQGAGHPVGPAPEPAAGIGVVEPLGEAVTDRHERSRFRAPRHFQASASMMPSRTSGNRQREGPGTEETGGMRIRLRRTARLAAGGARGRRPGRGRGLCWFSGRQFRRRRDVDRRGACRPGRWPRPAAAVRHPGAAWPRYGRDFARTGVAAGVATAGSAAASAGGRTSTARSTASRSWSAPW